MVYLYSGTDPGIFRAGQWSARCQPSPHVAGIVDLGPLRLQNSHINTKKNYELQKKIMVNSKAIECSGGAVRITNRHIHLPETHPDIDRSAQLLRSSEIGPIEVGCPARVWEASLGAGSD